MAENILIQYMRRRLSDEEKEKRYTSSQRTGKPFITISRQYGCPSKEIAEELQKELNKATGPEKKWNIINKEIIQHSAHELNIDPNKLKHVLEAEKKPVIDEVIAAMSTRYYKSDRQIRKTIREVIENLASIGYSIITGRGGVAITNDFPNSLHVRLFATQNWRLQRVMKKHDFRTEKEAFNHMRYVDKKRADMINHFSGGEFDFNKFDIQVNCEKFSPEEIARLIVSAMKAKKMI